MRLRALAFLVALGEAAVLAGLAVVCGALARDEDVDEHDCGGTCPAHDVGPDDLAEPRFLVLNGPTLAEYVQNVLIDRAVEGEACPDYVDEITWGTL